MNESGMETWSDEAVAAYITAWIEGEGCFYIAKRSGRYQYYCNMRLALRDDDTEVLTRLQKQSGVGKVYHMGAQIGNRNNMPQTAWHVFTEVECRQLIEILDKISPLSKKAKDYEIWKQAVFLWGQVKRGGYLGDTNRPVYDQMRELQQELIEVRKYRPPETLPERPEKGTLTKAILKALDESGQASTDEVCRAVLKENPSVQRSTVATSLVHLSQQGKIQRVDKGLYAPDPQS